MQQICPYCLEAVQPGQRCAICGRDPQAHMCAPHHLPPGTVLAERYLLGAVLGEGGFGITYLARDLRLGLTVAVKEYFPLDKAIRYCRDGLDVSSRPGTGDTLYQEGRARFLEEARLLAKLTGVPQIIQVRDCFEANNTAYIIVEYVEGQTLTQWLNAQGGRVSADVVLPMMRGLMDALSQLHALGLIHRDISPDNIMLENGQLRLLDFGAARETSRRTETFSVTLRHGFAPVEQYQPMGQGPWTDVYALSATIYYCVTGIAPPHALERIMQDKLKTPRSLGADIPYRQEQVLLYGLGVRPRRRFQSVEALAKELFESN